MLDSKAKGQTDFSWKQIFHGRNHSQRFLEPVPIILDAAPIIPVYFNSHVYLAHPALKGWAPTPMEHTDYRYVSLQP